MLKRWICALRGHRWKLVRISLEGHKMWHCSRCGADREGAYVGRPQRAARPDD